LKKVTVNVDTPDKIPEQEKSLEVTEDGDYTVTPDSGYVLKKVSVSVNTPDPKVEQEKSLNVTADGTYTVTPDSGKVLSKVTFNVDTPDKIPEQTKTLDVTKDGTYTVKPDSGKVLSEVTVNVDTPDQKPEMTKTLDITSNGTHTLTPDAGYVFKGVTVNVAVPSENLDEVISEQKTLISQIKSALAGKAAGGGGGGDLPPGYTRVDFIEFTGKQLVDTGIIGNQDTQIDVSFTWGNATQNHIFGCASSDNTASITSYMNGSWRFGAKSASKTISKNNTVLPYAARVNKSMIGVTGSNTAISGVEDFETIGTLLLGGARGSSGALPGSGIVGKAFYFRLWSGSTQIMNLVPVTDGTAYRFYDLVTKTFFDSITDTPLEGGNL
jgi:hypothetical protein